MSPARDWHVEAMVLDGRSTFEIATALGITEMDAELRVQLAMQRRRSRATAAAIVWDGRAGLARLDGHAIDLRTAPALGIAGLRAIDFLAGHRAELRISGEATRAMTGPEIGRARAWLDALGVMLRGAMAALTEAEP